MILPERHSLHLDRQGRSTLQLRAASSRVLNQVDFSSLLRLTRASLSY